MPLAMPRPTKRLGTSHLQLIQRIPADVKTRVREMRLTVPVGDHVAADTVSAKAEDIHFARVAVSLRWMMRSWHSAEPG